MTIRDLIEALQRFDDLEKDAFVALFKKGNTAELFDIEDVRDNNGNAQIGIYEEGAEII